MENKELLAEAVTVYMSMVKHIEELISQPSGHYGISFEQWLIIHEVSQSSTPLTMTAIAKARGVTKGAIARQLKHVLAKDYIVQQKDENDHRRIILTLTDAGKAAEKAIFEEVTSGFDFWLSCFGDAEAEQLLAGLLRFNEVVVQPELHKKLAMAEGLESSAVTSV